MGEVIPHLPNLSMTFFLFFMKYNILKFLQQSHSNALNLEKIMCKKWPNVINYTNLHYENIQCVKQKFTLVEVMGLGLKELLNYSS
jgi:hypothetical protein